MRRAKVKSDSFGYMASMKRRDWSGAVLACWSRAVQLGRIVIGVPDYETYLRHQREHHPERVPMNYEKFFLNRQAARYKGGGGRCC